MLLFGLVTAATKMSSPSCMFLASAFTWSTGHTVHDDGLASPSTAIITEFVQPIDLCIKGATQWSEEPKVRCDRIVHQMPWLSQNA